MIVGSDGESVEVRGDGPVAEDLVEALRLSDVGFQVDPDRHGVDCLCLRGGDDTPNRVRVKVFSAARGVTLAFVYKDSQVPLSTDRFAYGALVLKNRRASGEELVALIEYLASGLHPELRPAGLKRAFPYDIPR